MLQRLLLSDDDAYLFNEGSHFRLYDKLGAHSVTHGDENGAYFAVWAPNAERVSVIGDLNDWQKDSHQLMPRGQSGIWEGFFPGVGRGALYKYHIESGVLGYRVDKANPFSIFNETPPKTASIVWDLDYPWDDREWMATRHQRNRVDKPMSTYEMHLGWWRRVEEENYRSLSSHELAPQLAEHLERLGFTHVEFLPLMDHPFFGRGGFWREASNSDALAYGGSGVGNLGGIEAAAAPLHGPALLPDLDSAAAGGGVFRQ